MAYGISGILPEELEDEPDLPEETTYLWVWFIDLHSCRGNNGMSMSPITWRDLLDWQAVTGNQMEPWEVRAIRAIDGAYLTHANEQTSKKSSNKK